MRTTNDDDRDIRHEERMRCAKDICPSCAEGIPVERQKIGERVFFVHNTRGEKDVDFPAPGRDLFAGAGIMCRATRIWERYYAQIERIACEVFGVTPAEIDAGFNLLSQAEGHPFRRGRKGIEPLIFKFHDRELGEDEYLTNSLRQKRVRRLGVKHFALHRGTSLLPICEPEAVAPYTVTTQRHEVNCTNCLRVMPEPLKPDAKSYTMEIPGIGRVLTKAGLDHLFQRLAPPEAKNWVREQAASFRFLGSEEIDAALRRDRPRERITLNQRNWDNLIEGGRCIIPLKSQPDMDIEISLEGVSERGSAPA